MYLYRSIPLDHCSHDRIGIKLIIYKITSAPGGGGADPMDPSPTRKSATEFTSIMSDRMGGGGRPTCRVRCQYNDECY